MAHTEGKTMVSRAISVDQDDIQTLKGIQDRGVKFDMRKALDDSPENLEHLLKKDNLI
ncbi:PTS sugar transporter subunit IIB [Suicoccus acidiformans]|nr:PTS sugar transporter subunit IIB [Suicoccus acidiformans]